MSDFIRNLVQRAAGLAPGSPAAPAGPRPAPQAAVAAVGPFGSSSSRLTSPWAADADAWPAGPGLAESSQAPEPDRTPAAGERASGQGAEAATERERRLAGPPSRAAAPRAKAGERRATARAPEVERASAGGAPDTPAESRPAPAAAGPARIRTASEQERGPAEGSRETATAQAGRAEPGLGRPPATPGLGSVVQRAAGLPLAQPAPASLASLQPGPAPAARATGPLETGGRAQAAGFQYEPASPLETGGRTQGRGLRHEPEDAERASGPLAPGKGRQMVSVRPRPAAEATGAEDLTLPQAAVRPRLEAAAGPAEGAAPPVVVHIGTVEVRATQSPTAPAPPPAPAPGPQGFDDYAVLRAYGPWQPE